MAHPSSAEAPGQGGWLWTAARGPTPGPRGLMPENEKPREHLWFVPMGAFGRREGFGVGGHTGSWALMTQQGETLGKSWEKVSAFCR